MPSTSLFDRARTRDRFRVGVWFAFGVFWAFDLATTVVFFAVSYLHERNLLTVVSYRLFGLPGVGLAAVCYAAAVLGIASALPDRFDTRFLTTVTVLYASFAFYNATLIAQTTPLV